MANSNDKQKQKQAQRQTKRQEYKHQQDSKAAVRKDQIQRYPKTLFYPSSEYPRRTIPQKCIFDHTPLTFVPNIKRKGNSGWCCMRCLRHYKLSSPDDSPATPVPAPKPKNLLTLPDNPAFIPGSTILAAKLQALKFGDIGWITIVADSHDQNTSKGAFWVGRTLPSMVLAAIQSEQHRRFEYKGITYRVASVKPYQNAQKYLNILSRFCNPSAPQTVFVFTQKNIEHYQQGNYESVVAMVPCANRMFPVPMPVYYDKVNRRYFINEVTYTTLRRQHGLPYLKLHAAAASGTASWDGTVLRQNSELNLLGYNVSSTDGTTMYERRKLLRDIIDGGILSKHEVTNHLEWLIHFHEGNLNMENAIGEWRSDLMYLHNYQAGTQRTIWVEAFRSKFSGYTGVP